MHNTTQLFSTLRNPGPVTLSGALLRAGVVKSHREVKGLLVALIAVLVVGSFFILDSSMSASLEANVGDAGYEG